MMKQTIATAAGVLSNKVSISILPGSVIIMVTIATANLRERAAVAAAVGPQVATPAKATAFHGAGVTVGGVALAVSATTIDSPPPSPTPMPPSPSPLPTPPLAASNLKQGADGAQGMPPGIIAVVIVVVV